jgi:hypothetical protein
MKEILETIYFILSSLINQAQNYNNYLGNRMKELWPMIEELKEATPDEGKGEGE